MRLIDAHTHTHLRGSEDLETMARAGIAGVVVCAYLPVTPSTPSTLLDLFRWLVEVEATRLRIAGLEPKLALGVHPRCIPEGSLAAVFDRLAAALASGEAAAVGEVGLDGGDAREREVLRTQLELAEKARRPVVVHTARKAKKELFAQTIKVLEEAHIDPRRVLLDHLTPELVGEARAFGAWAGMTVQPGKSTPRDIAAALTAHGPERLIIDSDLSHVASDPLAVAHIARQLGNVRLEPDAVARVTGGHAAELFGFR